jgi:RNA:NAD 2'-phosphotransferase (TPT1/KptA family)
MSWRKDLTLMLRTGEDVDLDAEGYALIDDLVEALNQYRADEVSTQDVESYLSGGLFEQESARVRAVSGHTRDAVAYDEVEVRATLYIARTKSQHALALEYGLPEHEGYTEVYSTREHAIKSCRVKRPYLFSLEPEVCYSFCGRIYVVEVDPEDLTDLGVIAPPQ